MPNDKDLAVAPVAAGAIASADALAAFAAEGGNGLEGVTQADFSMPWISLLQDLSPQVKNSSPKHIDGAVPGLFYDQSSRELLKDFNFIVALYQRKMVEWKPRANGGGFVATHEVGYELKFPQDPKTRLRVTPEGNEIRDTRYFYGLRISDAGNLTPAILSMSSTQIKKAQDWVTLIDRLMIDDGKGGKMNPPIHSQIYKVSSEVETKATNSYFGYHIERVGSVSFELFTKMKEWRKKFQQTASSIKPPADDGAIDAEVVAPGSESKM